MRLTRTLYLHKKTFFFLGALVIYGTLIAYATPPSSPYTPGETLDPACAPGDTNCSVDLGGSTPDLQAVTDAGFTTTHSLLVQNNTLPGFAAFNATGTVGAQIGVDSVNRAYLTLTNGGANGIVRSDNITSGSRILQLPNVSGNLAEGVTDGSTTVHAGTDGIVNISSLLSGVAGPISIGTSGNTLYSSGLVGTEQGDTSVGGNIIFGSYAGQSATGVSGSTFLGYHAGDGATSVANANFIGPYSGNDASGAIASNFLGSNAGQYATNASNSNFLGWDAGQGATDASDSSFFGNKAGYEASSASGSNFFGRSAGYQATNAADSNFLGSNAGQYATNATNANFFGLNAGQGSDGAAYSNFLGINAGYQATGASDSNFLGSNAGYQATNATNSNFFGQKAGWNSANASYSNLFGFHAGFGFTGNDIGSNNIIIGTSISLPDATANAINIGGVLFGTGTYVDTDVSHDPSIVAQPGGKIGIAKVTPAYTLDVGNSSVAGIVAGFTNSTGSCTINPTTTSLSCSSDERLKKNIANLSDGSEWDFSEDDAIPEDILSKVLALKPVTYNWNTESDNASKHTGFIAQEVRQLFPDLVSKDATTGFLSLNYMGLIPYTVKALQELHVEITTIDEVDESNSLRDVLVRWFADVGNGITQFFAGTTHQKTLCVGDEGDETCITKSELDNLLAGQTASVSETQNDDTEEETPADDTNSEAADDEQSNEQPADATDAAVDATDTTDTTSADQDQGAADTGTPASDEPAPEPDQPTVDTAPDTNAADTAADTAASESTTDAPVTTP